MSISSQYLQLFQQPNTTDWIALFQAHLDSHDLKPEEALALAGLIHAQLRKPADQAGSNYARYARLMSALNHQMPEIYQQVIIDWHSTWGTK